MNKQIFAVGAAAVLALIGIVALVTYVNQAEDRAFEGVEMVKVLRVTEEVPANTAASELDGKVDTAQIPKAALVPGALATLDDVTGLVTKSLLVPGDQLTSAKFASAGTLKGDAAMPSGMQELTIPISGARLVGGVIQAGDRVGVFTSYNNGPVTSNPINNLLVLKVDAGTAASDGAAGTLITVAVKTLNAEKIVHAMEFGKVWLTKQNDETDTSGGKTITQKDVAP